MRKNLPDKDFFIGENVPEFRGYKIVECIGSGNNAHVFKAYSKDLNNNIACKVIPRERHPYALLNSHPYL